MIGAVSPTEMLAELASVDAEVPNTGNLPVVNVIGVPHSGTRSVRQYLAGLGYYPRSIHLQAHYHTAPFVAQVLASQYCVMAVRDPLLVLLSHQARKDDSLSAALANLDAFYALTWPAEVYAVGVNPSLPDVGSYGNYPGKVSYRIPDKAVMASNLGQYWTALAAREATYRPKLTAIGFTNLPWWS